MSWLPMKHYRRNAWTPWLWGQVRWWGTLAPWERSPTLCSQCGQHHGASVQSRLVYCPAWGEFWDLWRRSWTDWAQQACQWQQTATSLELWLCATLLIPQSLINAIPTTERHKLRAEVGLFQFRMIQAVQTLSQKLADPTPHQPPSPLWLTKFGAQTLPPRETAQNLRSHVGAPMRSDMKRKRRAEPATAEPMDPDLWIRDAHAAHDDEAVAWLVRMQETNTNQEEQTQKSRRLDVGARRWAQYQTASDKLAQEHAQRTYDAYHNAHTSKVTRRHLRELHTLYSNTLTAKTEHHLLGTNLIEEQMAGQRLHSTYTNMCLERRQWYEQAKHDTVTWYADSKTSLLTYKRYERMYTDTNMLLVHHLRQAHYMWHQQEHIMNLTQGFNDNCKEKTTRIQTSRTDNIPHTETTTGTMGPHLVGSPIATPTKTTQSALGSKRVGNPADMTTTTSTGKHGGPAMS